MERRPPEVRTLHDLSPPPWRPISQPLVSLTSLHLYSNTSPSKKSSLITTCPIPSLHTQFIFLQGTFFFLSFDICVFVYYLALPSNESFRSSELGLLGPPQHSSLLDITGHTLSSTLLCEEIYLTPRDAKNQSSTSRKQHSPSIFKP